LQSFHKIRYVYFLPSIYSLLVNVSNSSASFFVSQTIKFLYQELNLTNVLVVSGTLRSNLDPFNLHDDATLWDALQRSYLVESTNRDSMITKEEVATSPGTSHAPVSRFGLDTIIEDEGANLSLGQVRLFSMALK
jgi:ABC-type multidrug transport system fused ATPase/permease subunit